MNVLEVTNLRKTYRLKQRQVVAVEDLSFEIAQGEIVGLLGPNGAGKTTTIKCIANLVIPTSGSILVNGNDPRRNGSAVFRSLAAVLEGNRNVYWRLTVRENLAFFAGLQGISTKESAPYAQELIEFFRLEEKRNVEARYLSRGMQQRLAVAAAFIKKTDILLLDEPTLGLDVESTHELKNLILAKSRAEKKTVILSTHNMKLAEDICERVIVIDRGRMIAADTVTSLKSLFAMNTYSFALLGEVTEEARTELQNRFSVARIEENQGRITMEVEVGIAEEIYDLIDYLRSLHLRIERIESRTPDFEDVYLKIVKGSGP